ncbi:hypothetical protein P4O66_003467 [Electrophorus voltai]|uniref:Uncharacterized protein n=1 Tax=Electrophorus voltai TaxID=2609070 RepID=A0AAD8YPG8_9TELE|nr:hypothetical protein P4O66_003467 [Electrophorus voltai]
MTEVSSGASPVDRPAILRSSRYSGCSSVVYKNPKLQTKKTVNVSKVFCDGNMQAHVTLCVHACVAASAAVAGICQEPPTHPSSVAPPTRGSKMGHQAEGRRVRSTQPVVWNGMAVHQYRVHVISMEKSVSTAHLLGLSLQHFRGAIISSVAHSVELVEQGSNIIKLEVPLAPFTPLIAGPLIAGPLIAGPLITGPLIAGPLIAGPLIAGLLIAGPLITGPLITGPLITGPLIAGPLPTSPVRRKSYEVAPRVPEGCGSRLSSQQDRQENVILVTQWNSSGGRNAELRTGEDEAGDRVGTLQVPYLSFSRSVRAGSRVWPPVPAVIGGPGSRTACWSQDGSVLQREGTPCQAANGEPGEVDETRPPLSPPLHQQLTALCLSHALGCQESCCSGGTPQTWLHPPCLQGSVSGTFLNYSSNGRMKMREPP